MISAPALYVLTWAASKEAVPSWSIRTFKSITPSLFSIAFSIVRIDKTNL
jgi:hypothetical protein